MGVEERGPGQREKGKEEEIPLSSVTIFGGGVGVRQFLRFLRRSEEHAEIERRVH